LASCVPIVAKWRIPIGCALKGLSYGPLAADQHKQIGILRGASSFNMRIDFLIQNENIEKSQELKGQTENF
jgi:hypothetical protein